MLARFVADPPTVTMQRIKALLIGGASITHGSTQAVQLCVKMHDFNSTSLQVCQHLLTCRGASQLVKLRRTILLLSSNAEEGVWCVITFLFPLLKPVCQSVVGSACWCLPYQSSQT